MIRRRSQKTVTLFDEVFFQECSSKSVLIPLNLCIENMPSLNSVECTVKTT